MKTYEELARGATKRAEHEILEKKRRNKKIGITLCIVLVAAAAVMLTQYLRSAERISVIHADPSASLSQDTSAIHTAESRATSTVANTGPYEQTAEPSVAATVPASTAAPSTAIPVSGENTDAFTTAAGENETITQPVSEEYEGGQEIWTGDYNNTFVYVGEKITDAEAAAYFAENAGWVLQALTASGVNTENAKISETGYCHMTLGETPEVRQNFRDYLVYSGDTLIAILTLYKENGEFFCTPAFGGPWFADYAAFLQQHKGETLYYYYNGILELIVTPQNEVVNPMGVQSNATAPDYNTLACPEIAYVP